MASAQDYAVRAVKLFLELPTDDEAQFSPPERAYGYSLVMEVASAFYYNLEDFEKAASIANQAIKLDPQQQAGYFLLGNSQSRLNQFEAAAQTWVTAITIDPTVAAYHINYASTLMELDRTAEAINSMSEAIRLAPDEPRYYLIRGRTYRYLNRDADAIIDFTEAVRLSEEATRDEQSARTPRSLIEYFREMSARDQADAARFARANSYLALGQVEEAQKDADYLLQHGDAAAKYSGYCLQGEIYEARAQLAEAIVAYSSAIQIAPAQPGAHQQRADAYLAQGQINEALPDLAFLADRFQNPKAAIERLSTILERQPNYAPARKLRGFAYLEDWRPSKAEEDLTAALQVLSNDPDIYLWRGLAKITHSPFPEEEQWNNSLTIMRVRDAIDDLGMAVYLAPENMQALDALKWLIDRASAEDYIMFSLLDEDERPSNLFNVIPTIREPFIRFQIGLALSIGREWDSAITELQVAQHGFMEAGLPVLATRIEAHIADIYLRLYELQLALDHLSRAKKALTLHWQPLTEHVALEAKQRQQEFWRKSGGEGIIPEVDYLGIYAIGQKAFMRMLNLLEAQTFARLGDYTHAISVIEKIEQDIADDPSSIEGDSVREMIAIVTILRDASEYSRAFDLLKKLIALDMDEHNQMALLNLLGTLWLRVGNTDAAMQSFQQAYALATNLQSEDISGIALNLVSNLFLDDRFEEALATLDSIDIEQIARSERKQYSFYCIRAQLLAGMGRSADAQQAILQALSIAERSREGLRLYDSRISWQATQEQLYRMGVRIAVMNHDSRVAFALGEKARARVFVDQLAAGHLPLPPSVSELLEIQQTLLAKKAMLLELTDSITKFGASFIDFELVRKLASLDQDMKVLDQTDDGTKLLSVAKIAEQRAQIDESLLSLHQRMEDERLASSTVTSGAMLSVDDLRQVLLA